MRVSLADRIRVHLFFQIKPDKNPFTAWIPSKSRFLVRQMCDLPGLALDKQRTVQDRFAGVKPELNVAVSFAAFDHGAPPHARSGPVSTGPSDQPADPTSTTATIMSPLLQTIVYPNLALSH